MSSTPPQLAPAAGKSNDLLPTPPRYRPRGQSPSAMQRDPPKQDSTPTAPDGTAPPSTAASTIAKRRPSLSFDPPSGWWGAQDRARARPWREREAPRRTRTIPPEQEDRWLHTRQRVSVALRSVLGNTLDVTHEALAVGAEVLQFAPLPGLGEAARVLLNIWDSLQFVETNRLACLRLTERCADILLAVREEIFEAGDQVGEELSAPVTKLTDSFLQVQFLLEKQVHRPFLKRYLRRDEILRSIGFCDAELSDALGLFSLSIQIRTLKQLQAAENRRQADTMKLLDSIARRTSEDKTPKQTPADLPAASATPPPPAYELPAAARPGSPRRPTAEEIQQHIQAIVAQQNEHDDALDTHDLRTVMRTALATASDADMIRVLQVQRDEMPEAIKTLQRALEQCGDGARDGEGGVGEAAAGAPAEGLQLMGLSRQATFGSQQSQESERSTKSSRETGERSSGRTASSWGADGDPLDREFIENGIDALRRLSDHEVSLPSWTITKYEVDLEEKVGIGFFSDVYRGIWRNHTVAVKVLAPTTPQSLFIREMSVWKTLRHPNLLPLLGASSARGDAPWFFVSPYMKNGTIVRYLKSLQPGDVWDPVKMVYEIAHGMEYLHNQGVLHGDLKGSNVLIDDDRHCVLADFGQSEMKSEAYRISGTPPPHGTLRWQAPELMDGMFSARLTRQVDVYAFAMVCVEILTKGALPWPMMDDEAVRRSVLQENKRPPIPLTTVSAELSKVIEACWARDPAARPSFRSIAHDLRKMRRPSPVTQKFKDLWDEDPQTRRSPDMVPIDLPYVGRSSSDSDLPRSHRPSSSLGRGLEHSVIPLQRIITPIRGEASAGQSPVEDDRQIKMPVPEPSPYEPSLSASSSSRSSMTGSRPYSDFGVELGPDLSRFESPPPADDIIAQRKNESRYRLCLQHDYHASLTLPLWDPSPVEVGAVGFLSKPCGTFVTLFNSFDPPKSSGGRTKGMASLYGYGRPKRGSQRQDKRTAAQRSLDVIYGLMTFKSRGEGLFSQSVSRRYTFPLLAGHKSAYLCAETTRYHYMETLTAPKAWFKANIDQILQLYGTEHRLQREDVVLVIGTLEAPDYGLFVSHNNPDGQVHFNVFSPPRAGQRWGTFSVDTEAPPMAVGGPAYHEDVPGKHISASNVSIVNSSGTWNAVLLARLRFRPDSDEPTSL